MSIALRCLLLLQPAAAVAAALPGAMTRTLSEALKPYREHASIPWALLDALSAPAPASGPHLQQSLGLPAMLGILSILLPVRVAAQQHAMSSSHCHPHRQDLPQSRAQPLTCDDVGLSISTATNAKLECAALMRIHQWRWTEHARILTLPACNAG